MFFFFLLMIVHEFQISKSSYYAQLFSANDCLAESTVVAETVASSAVEPFVHTREVVLPSASTSVAPTAFELKKHPPINKYL